MASLLLRAALLLPLAAITGLFCARLAYRYALLIEQGAEAEGSTLWSALRDGWAAEGAALRATAAPAGAMLLAAACLPLVLAPSVPNACRFVACAVLLALSLIDLRCRLLPDAMTLPLLWAGLMLAWSGAGVSLYAAVAGAALGYAGLWLVNAVYFVCRRRQGVGGGDMKLFAAVGAWAGWELLPGVLLAACLAAVFCALWCRAWGVRLQSLAFGPFISIPSAAAILLGGDVQYLFLFI